MKSRVHLAKSGGHLDKSASRLAKSRGRFGKSASRFVKGVSHFGVDGVGWFEIMLPTFIIAPRYFSVAYVSPHGAPRILRVERLQRREIGTVSRETNAALRDSKRP